MIKWLEKGAKVTHWHKSKPDPDAHFGWRIVMTGHIFMFQNKKKQFA